ncbi:MAG: restriction endonuclease subunit S, partial [Turicibacter sp.]|nr:restriction endonuclease subunit S [Turicibacter sp.]
SIISLPQGVFLPYTGVKTNIIYATKINQNIKPSQKRKDFWYFDVKSDGYSLDNHRRKLESGNDLDKYQEYRQLDDNQRQKMLDAGFEIVPLDKVRENSFDLLGSRYREQKSISTKWEMVSLEDVFLSMRNGLNVNQTDTVGKYRVSRIQSISEGVFDINKTKWTNDDVSEEHLLKKDDILLSHINSYEHLAKTAIFDDSFSNRVVHGVNLIRLVPNTERIIPAFAKHMLKSDSFIEFAKSFAQRAVNQASIRVSDLKTIKIPLPPLDIQQQIADELDEYQRRSYEAKLLADSYVKQIRNELNEIWGE